MTKHLRIAIAVVAILLAAACVTASVGQHPARAHAVRTSMAY